MGWFNEQIRDRTRSDQRILEDSLLQMASIVLDRWGLEEMADRTFNTREALNEILKYYHRKPVEIPDNCKDVTAQIEYAMRPNGMMYRDVNLEEGLQNDAFGAMLGFMKDTQTPVALIPGMLGGYYFKNPVTGKRTRITRKTAKLFAPDALSFYLPLPMKKLGIRDLLLYMKKNITTGDLVLIIAATLAMVLIGMIEPRFSALLPGR